MNRASTVAYVAAAYLAVLGVILIVAPNSILPIFGFAATSEIWIRIVGTLLASFAWYAFTAARADDLVYFKASVVQGPALFLVFLGLFLANLAPAMLVAFGAIQLIFAIWMWWALRGR